MAVQIPEGAARGVGAPHTHDLYRLVIDKPYAIFNPGDHACFDERTALDLVGRSLAHFAGPDEPIPVPVEPQSMVRRVRTTVLAASLNNRYSAGDQIVIPEAEYLEAYAKGWVTEKDPTFDQKALDEHKKKAEAARQAEMAKLVEDRAKLAAQDAPQAKAPKAAPASK